MVYHGSKIKRVLTDRDIKRVSDKQRAREAGRHRFEAKIEVFLSPNGPDETFVLLCPTSQRYSSFAHYELSAHLFDPDTVRDRRGCTSDPIWKKRFDTYRQFKNYLRQSSLRRATDQEIEELRRYPTFRRHYEVDAMYDVESVELNTGELEWLKQELLIAGMPREALQNDGSNIISFSRPQNRLKSRAK